MEAIQQKQSQETHTKTKKSSVHVGPPWGSINPLLFSGHIELGFLSLATR